MAAVYLSSSVQEIANAGVPKVTKKFVARTGRSTRPFADWIKSKKKPGNWTGGTIPTYLKDRARNVAGQAFAGDATVQAAVKVKEGVKGEVYVARYIWNHAIVHDDLMRSLGCTILPNQNGDKEITSRVEQRTIQDDKILYNVLVENNESFLDAVDETYNELLWKQGASAIDVVGINGLMPIALHGTCMGIERKDNPCVQHVVFAGQDANSTASGNVGPRGTTGSGGTLLPNLAKFVRRLRQNAATCGLPKGTWKCFGGSGFFDLYKYQANNYAGMQFNRDAAGGGNVNLILSDEDMKIARDFSMEWDPTLDTLDVTASTEVGVGLSCASVVFSAGNAKAVAYFTAAGAVNKIVLLDAGSGYSTVPTVTITGGGASNATTQVTIYSLDSTTTGKIQVAADDSRLGKIANIAVTGAGSGYTVTATAAPFINRLYCFYEPAWEYPVQNNLDFFMSIPPDEARYRRTEQQVDHMACIKPLAMSCNGIFLAASA